MMRPFVVMPAGLPDGAARPGQEHGGPAGAATMTAADAALADHAARLAANADQVALCLDFDGTLSPIVPYPEAARLLLGVAELLGPMAARFAAVALISGRPAEFLAEHAAAPRVRYLGLYGLRKLLRRLAS
jgi:trehalose 6-phosphate phosphatase